MYSDTDAQAHMESLEAGYVRAKTITTRVVVHGAPSCVECVEHDTLLAMSS